LALIYTYGVRRGLLTENQWVSLCSTGPAQIFGLYPQKGEIAVGSDADLVVFDPHRQVTLSSSILHENVDYTPYEGFQLKGFPEMTLLHGKIIAEKGVFLGGAQARFIPRKPFKSHRQE
jgi:dihydropyrimidinase